MVETEQIVAAAADRARPATPGILRRTVQRPTRAVASAPPDTSPDPAGRALAVLLGASNLTRGLPAAVAAVRHRLGGGPLDALIATGHGRSYGVWSRVLVRAVPSIADCGLWSRLERRPAETAARRPGTARLALLTDVGNDVGYGHLPATIAGWVDACVGRLAAAGVSGLITRLPLASLRALPAWRLSAAVRIFFPRQRLAVDELLRRAEELERRLDEVAAAHGFARAGLDERWYGPDGIHIWRWKLLAAWRELLAGAPVGVSPAASDPPHPPRLGDRWRLTVARPRRYRLLGIDCTGGGGGRLSDGTRVELY